MILPTQPPPSRSMEAAVKRDDTDLRHARRSTAGAVYVEFLIAFLPVFFFFLSLVQLIFVQTASIITKHAAVKAVRAAVVVLPDDPMYYGGVGVGDFSGKRRDDIERAARIPLATMGLDADAVKVSVSAYHRSALLRLQLEYRYRCKVPLGRLVVCGLGQRKTLTAEAAMPSQGADYVY
ncbi:MAG: hypothetical protein QM820_55795 [Minicystis sp.]